MKNFILYIVLLIFWNPLFAQKMVFKISEISISNFENIEPDPYHVDNGPYIYFKGFFSNNSKADIYLYPPSSKTYVSFCLNDTTYQWELISIPFFDYDSILIEQNQQFNIEYGINIFLGTKTVMRENKRDYKHDLLMILPSLKVFYSDKKNYFKVENFSTVKLSNN